MLMLCAAQVWSMLMLCAAQVWSMLMLCAAQVWSMLMLCAAQVWSVSQLERELRELFRDPDYRPRSSRGRSCAKPAPSFERSRISRANTAKQTQADNSKTTADANKFTTSHHKQLPGLDTSRAFASHRTCAAVTPKVKYHPAPRTPLPPSGAKHGSKSTKTYIKIEDFARQVTLLTDFANYIMPSN